METLRHMQQRQEKEFKAIEDGRETFNEKLERLKKESDRLSEKVKELENNLKS